METETSKSNTNAAVMGGLVVLAFIGVGYLIHWSGKQKSKSLSGSKRKKK